MGGVGHVRRTSGTSGAGAERVAYVGRELCCGRAGGCGVTVVRQSSAGRDGTHAPHTRVLRDLPLGMEKAGGPGRLVILSRARGRPLDARLHHAVVQ